MTMLYNDDSTLSVLPYASQTVIQPLYTKYCSRCEV